MAVVFEQPANNLIGFLSRYDWITLYPINPLSLQKFRETFVVSRANDDAKDAFYLAHLLATHAVKNYDRQIALCFAHHPEHWFFANLPGAGPVFAPRLLASFGTQRDRYATAANFQCASGIAPVTKQSGKKLHVHRRYRCSEFFKQGLHEWAAESRFFSGWARAYYEMKRAGGMGHLAAVRSLAYKWIRVLWRCWQDRTIYEEARYVAALRKAGSPLIAWMEKHPESIRPRKQRKSEMN